jgi:7-cyano-7-deazaguanine synthase
VTTPGWPDPEHQRVAVLASGGLDSAVLVAELARRGHHVQPIYVRFGLVWEPAEEAHLRRFLDTLPAARTGPLVALDFPIADVYGSHWSVSGQDIPDADSDDAAVYLPGRNLCLVAKSAVWCALHEAPVVALGTLKGNPFADSSREFFADLESVVARGMGWRLDIATPFADRTKAEVLLLGRDLALHHTFSCIHPAGDDHCGRCNKCAERRRAFAELSIEDATTYAGR